MRVEDKVILITGGASGIGFAVAKELLKNNAKGVSIVDISENASEAQKEMEDLFGKEKVIFVKADITDKKQLEDAFEATINFYKQLDIVLNNAGITNEHNWEKMLNVNLIAVIRGSYLAMKNYLPKYKSGEEGLIVNTSSVVGLQSTQIAPVYSAAKHGVISLGESLSGDEFYKTYKVRILTICPGYVKTGIQKGPVSTRLLFPHRARELQEKLKVVEQSVESVAEAFVEVIRKGKNGSVYVVENQEPVYEVVIPEKEDLRRVKMQDM